MNAADVMTTGVITVGLDASVQDTATTLLRNRISAVPVVDADSRLIGIVSESDLMRRTEAGTERHRSTWLEMFTSKEVLADDFVKSHSRKIADVMTRKVVTVAPDTPIAQVAHVLERNRIKRVPVVAHGKVIGIVSRANLLQAFAGLKPDQAPKAAADDAQIRRNILAEMSKQSWTTPALINAIVQDGTVELWGLVDTPAEKKAIRVLVETVPGVRMVNDNLVVRSIVSAI